jgi:hypothetical protein
VQGDTFEDFPIVYHSYRYHNRIVPCHFLFNKGSFAQNEGDMERFKYKALFISNRFLTGAGYGTDKWVHISATEAAETEQAFARLVDAVEHIEEEYEIDEISDSAEPKLIPPNPNAESGDAFLGMCM